jgi:hypothetical protein
MSFFYAGIGSRKTPKFILQIMEDLGEALAQKNFILRSGGADSADSAFEKGCDKGNGKKEIYLPWKGFNSHKSELYQISDNSYEIAKKYHPYWHNLKRGARLLQSRNCYQVLGYDLKSFSDIVICYTENGKISGGTGQALRIADDYNIPVINLGDPKLELTTESILNMVDNAVSSNQKNLIF